MRRTASSHTEFRWLALAAAIAAAFFAALPCLAADAKKLDDQQIANAIDDEFFLDPAIDANRIDVTVNDGIAELTGQVRDILARDRATEIAELVKGVRTVSNRIEVRPSPLRKDADIRKDVIAALARDPAADAYELSVDVKDNVVTLTGEVDSWTEKQLAERVAKGVRGVVGLNDEIKVGYDMKRPDSEIQVDIKEQLDWDAMVDGYLIGVSVDDHQVKLTGTVGSAAEKRWAEDDAWKVSGVTGVDTSGLKVDWWAEDVNLRHKKYAERSDAEIASAIEEAALYDPRVSGFHIDADVQGGWVTLRGHVDNLQASRAAAQLARNTVGVIGLTNRLKIQLDNPPPDDVIRSQVEAALAVDPVTDAYDIGVDVDDGWVTLTGAVDSPFERIEAGNEAGKVTGVVAVRNRLAVADTVAEVIVPYYYDPWAVYPTTIRIEPSESAESDRTIRERIASELFWSPFVDRDDVNIEVDHGKATLTGKVDSWREYYAAADNAYEGGATWVDNELQVVN
jgi:osmotically-inducible protein OsmY